MCDDKRKPLGFAGEENGHWGRWTTHEKKVLFWACLGFDGASFAGLLEELWLSLLLGRDERPGWAPNGPLEWAQNKTKLWVMGLRPT